jgi:putative membrane protein
VENVREKQSLTVSSFQAGERARRRPLVVVIDIDNDLSDAGIVTPLVGFEEVLDAAIKFALTKPEDSDINALFSGLSVYRKLSEEGLNPEIVVLAGHKTDLLEAQKKIRSELKEVIKELNEPVEFYLVLDSEYDLLITESIRDLGPIAGIKRVVVEQHLGIEASYVLLSRYIKKAFLDPRFSKYTLGVPGALLALGTALSLAGYGTLALKVLGFLLGIIMIIRGFNLETHISNIFKALYTQHGLILVSYVLFGIFLVASTVITYYAFISVNNVLEGLAMTLKMAIPVLMTGVILYILIGRVLYKLVQGITDLWGEIAESITAFFSALAFYRLGVALSSLKPNQIPEKIVDSLLLSGFVQLLLIGISIAVLIEVLRRAGRLTGKGP